MDTPNMNYPIADVRNYVNMESDTFKDKTPDDIWLALDPTSRMFVLVKMNKALFEHYLKPHGHT